MRLFCYKFHLSNLSLFTMFVRSTLFRNIAAIALYGLFCTLFCSSSTTLFAQVVNAYLGPLPRITSGFGADGTFQVDTLRFPATGWEAPSVQNVEVYVPRGATSPRPTVMFAHGYGGFNSRFYGEILQHAASRGYVAVFVPYPITLNFPALYRTMDSGFAEAVRRYPRLIDSTRIGFMGHSFGAGAIPSIAYKAYVERGWGKNGKFLFPMAPWYALETTPAMTRTFPNDTKLLVHVYQTDLTNDHRLAIDIFRTINISAAEKDFVTVLPDTVNNYVFAAGHGLCNTLSGTNSAAFDGYDVYATFRHMDALMEYTFNPSNAAAKNVALGNGSAEQVFMGVVGNRTLKPLRVSDAPVPDPVSPRAQFSCTNELNPRREFCTFTTSVQSPIHLHSSLLQIIPNPSNHAALIRVMSQQAENMTIHIYNVLGQEVIRLTEQTLSAGGVHEVSLDTSLLPQGLYQCRVEIGEAWISSSLLVQH
jgi:Secretion system C-terminal sorting domain